MLGRVVDPSNLKPLIVEGESQAEGTMSPYPEQDGPLMDGKTTTTVVGSLQSAPPRSFRSQSFTRLWHRIAAEFVAEVPPGDAVCEFDCQRTQCLTGEWEMCERRLAGAKNELWPDPMPRQRAATEKAV